MSTTFLLLLQLIPYLIHASTFNCTISDNTIASGITLTVNQQHLETIGEGDLQFYALDASGHTSDLHIYITPIGNCDPDLFVNFSGHKCPDTATNFDDQSRSPGTEHSIITPAQYNNQQYVYITIMGWTTGQYTILYRFMMEDPISNPLIIYDNIPQFFIIDSNLNNADDSWALIDYTFAINENIPTYKISFYLDSYIANTVFFKVWIVGSKPNSLTIQNDGVHVLYYHTDPSVSSLRLSSNDPKVIKCRDVANNRACYGYNSVGSTTDNSNIVNHTSHIYMIVNIDSTKSDIIQNQLQITINTEPYIENKTLSDAQCTDENDCGPNGQTSQDQLPLFHGETMWNALIADSKGVIQPEFFKYDYTQNGECDSIQIKIADITGFTNVYISGESDESKTSWPNNKTYTLKSVDSNSNSQILTISNASTDTYHIGVYPDIESKNHKQVLFTITLSLEDCKHTKIVWTEIDSGTAVAGNTQMESFDYYKYNEPIGGNNVIISIVKDFGDIDLYVNIFPNTTQHVNRFHNVTNYKPPNSRTAIWKDTSSPDANDTTISKLIEIRADDAKNCKTYPCSYGISVHCGKMSVPSGADAKNMKCQYTLTVSSNGAKQHSIIKLQTSQPVNDLIHKGDEKHIYEYDYYALANDEMDDVTITVTPMNFDHNDKDVNIYLSISNPLIDNSNDGGDNIWIYDNINITSNTLIINKTDINSNDTLYIGVELTQLYINNSDESEAYEFSIICYTTQTVKLPMETPFVRSLKPHNSVTFKAMVDIGKDFTLFIASTDHVIGQIYVSNLYNNNEPPTSTNNKSYEWNAKVNGPSTVAQITINYESNPKACKSVKLSKDVFTCEYWIVIYNPNIDIKLECAILGTTMFHQLNNGENIKSQITADDIEYTKRFVMNPQIMPFIKLGNTYDLIVSASIIVGDIMGMYIGSTPFANDLYSQLDGRGHDFAIGRNISIDRSYYIAIVAYPGDIFTLTATFMDVTGLQYSTTSYLKSGITELGILDTKVLNKTHTCHVYIHNSSSSMSEITYTSVIGGDKAVVFTKYVAASVTEEDLILNCDNKNAYVTLDYLFDDNSFDEDIGILFGPRDYMQYDNMESGDYIYISVYPLQYLQDIDAKTGYYMEYRLLAYSLSDHIVLSNGVPTNIYVSENMSIYATIPITKKMLNVMSNKPNNHFIDISFTKYSFGTPIIYISTLYQKPNKQNKQFILTENDRKYKRRLQDTDIYDSDTILNDSYYDYYNDVQDYTKQETFGITINLQNLSWPEDNNPWSFITNENNKDDLWFYNKNNNEDIANYNFYDDDFEIDDWIGYLYLTIICVDGGSVSLDLQSNYIEENIVSELLYGVPTYSQIQTQGEMKYFLLDVGDKNLLMKGTDDKSDQTNDITGALQISLSMISGSADLYIDDFTGKKDDYPDPENNKTFSKTTKSDTNNAFKIIDIDLAQLLSVNSQHIIIGIQATSQYTEFKVTAQEINKSPTQLSVDTPIHAAISQVGDAAINFNYSIYEFVVSDAKNDYYIIVNAINGKVGMYVNAPDKYPDIPTTAADSSMYSADLSYAFQMVYIDHNDIAKIMNSSKKSIKNNYIYRIVVGLIDTEKKAEFTINVKQKSQTTEIEYIGKKDGPITSVLSKRQKQLFHYELSAEDKGEELTITLSTIFGDPSMYIGFNTRPVPNNNITYKWSTSAWGVDSIRIKNASDGIYFILVVAGNEMSTQYTLSAVCSSTEHIITNGMSLFETIHKIDTKYYVFYPSMNEKESGNIDVSIVAYSGDINIFISSNGTYKHPNQTYHNHMFQINSDDAMKSQSLSVDINNVCDDNTFECKPMYISVAPIDFETDAITYSIMIAQNIICILSDGVSIQSTLNNKNNKRKICRFTIDKDALQNHTIRFTMSAITDNEFVSMTVYPTGTLLNDTGSITNPMFDDSETIIIKNLCLNSRANSEGSYTYNPTLCVYLISIGFNNNNTNNNSYDFNLIAATDQTFMTLQDGITITDSIETAGTFKYYNFYVNDRKYIGKYVLEVDVNPIYGDPDLYIAKDLPGNKVVTTDENYEWRSMRFGEDNKAIPINNDKALGVYQIGIYSYSVTQYTLNGWLRKVIFNLNETDSISSVALTMLPGQKRYGYSNGSIICYAFNTDNTKSDIEIEITVDVHEGSVDAYIAFDNFTSNPENASDWDMYRDDISQNYIVPKVIPISPSKLENVNKIYTCVQGGQDAILSLYQIHIDYATGLKTLDVNGKPSSHSIEFNEYQYYYIDVVDVDMGIYINVESLTDGVTAPFVYMSRINRHPGANDTIFCDNEIELNEWGSICTMKYTDESGDRLRVVLINNIYSVGKYYISIRPDNEHQNDMVNMTYQIIASSTAPNDLSIGVPITDTLIKSNWKYYIWDRSKDMNDDKSSVPIIITFTLLSGSTRTYITNSVVAELHNINNYDIVNDNSVKSIDNGTNNNTAITFAGSHTIKISSAENLYYFCNKDNALDNIIQAIEDIILDSFTGNHYEDYTEDINNDESGYCKYYIAVYADVDSEYSLSIHYEDGLNKLKNDGTPINGLLTYDHYAYYYCVLTGNNNDKLQILLTDRDGNIDKDLSIYINIDSDNKYVDNLYDKPTKENHQNYTDNGSIMFINPPSGTYYISVYANSNEDIHYYSILATISRIILIENYPQIINTKYLQLKENKKLNDAGYYFSYDVFKNDDSNSIEFDIHSKLNNADEFTFYITNSELMTDCDSTVNCPNRATCTNENNCKILLNHNVDNPVIIENTNPMYCNYNGNSKLCTYYISIVLTETYELQVKDNDDCIFDITAKSSSSTSGLLIYDGSSIYSKFKNINQEYNSYVSYIPENINFADISLETCIGNVDLYYSSNIVSPTQFTATVDSNEKEKIDVIKINMITENVIYIGVRNTATKNNILSEYKLNVGYQIDKFRPNIDTNDLSVQNIHTGEAVITFKLIQIPNDLDDIIDINANKITILNYKLYFADSTNKYIMYTQCGLNKLEKWDKCNQQSSDINTCFIDLKLPQYGDKYVSKNKNNEYFYKRSITGLKINTTYRFNVLIQMSVSNLCVSCDDKIYYTTYYSDHIEISSFDNKYIINGKNITKYEIAFGITIPIIFILIGLLLYYYKKHKRVMRDLSVLEMEEVPINKVIKAAGGARFKNYDYDKNNNNKFISKFAKKMQQKRDKMKEKKPREKAKKYHSLLSSHDYSDDDDDDLEDSLNIEIDDDDDDENDRQIVS